MGKFKGSEKRVGSVEGLTVCSGDRKTPEATFTLSLSKGQKIRRTDSSPELRRA